MPSHQDTDPECSSHRADKLILLNRARNSFFSVDTENRNIRGKNPDTTQPTSRRCTRLSTQTIFRSVVISIVILTTKVSISAHHRTASKTNQKRESKTQPTEKKKAQQNNSALRPLSSSSPLARKPIPGTNVHPVPQNPKRQILFQVHQPCPSPPTLSKASTPCPVLKYKFRFANIE